MSEGPDLTAQLPNETEEYEKLKRWRSEFQQDLKHHEEWLGKKKVWEEFYDGEQLSQEEKKALRKRKQPEVVINQIQPFIDGVIGDFFGRRVMMRAKDKGSQDFETAKHITEALRYVEERSRFDEAESFVANQLLIGGVGWYKVSIEFEFLEPEIKISWCNNNDVIVDRRSKKRDLSDAKRLYETVWTEVEDLVELYPKFEAEIRRSAALEEEYFRSTAVLQNRIGDQYAGSENGLPSDGIEFDVFIDPKRKRLRLVNIWERVRKRVEFAYHPDLPSTVKEVTDFTKEDIASLEKNFKGVQYFISERWEINSGIFIATKILEEKNDVRPHDSLGKMPYIRAIAKVEHKETLSPYGLVKQYIDPQKEYNKRRSKLLHKSNTTRIIAEEGAFPDNDIERLRNEANKPDGVIIHNPDRKLEIDKDQPSQVDLYLLELSRSEIQGVGVTKEFSGQEDKVLSGRAIALRQTEGQKMVRPYFAALRSARRNVFEIVLEEIQQYWTSEKLVKITDDPESANVILNQRSTDELGNVIIKNNLKLGKYDIKVDEDLETPNQRSENFRNLVNLGEIALKAGEPFPLEMLIKASDLPNKQEWLKEIQNRREQQMQMLQLQALAGAGPQNGQPVTPTL